MFLSLLSLLLLTGSPPPADRLLTVPQVADRLSLARSTVWFYIGNGTIPSVTLGRARRVRESDLDVYIASLEGQAAVS